MGQRTAINVYRKDRIGKSGGGVLILVKTDLKVRTGPENMIILSVFLQLKCSEKLKIMMYMPLHTASQRSEIYNNLLDGTNKELEDIIKNSKNVILTGDFN